jgi:nucleoside-diphosphate-sugar epimerase
VYIDDLITGFELCGEKKQAIGQIYMIGGNESPTLNELVLLIAKVLNVPKPKRRFPFVWPVWFVSWICKTICKPFGIQPPIFPRRVDWFKKNRDFDISKAKKELGYEPKIDLKTGISNTVEWYKQEGWL